MTHHLKYCPICSGAFVGKEAYRGDHSVLCYKWWYEIDTPMSWQAVREASEIGKNRSASKECGSSSGMNDIYRFLHEFVGKLDRHT